MAGFDIKQIHLGRLMTQGPWWRLLCVWTLALFVGIIVLLGLIDMNFLWLFGRSPGFSDIKDPGRSLPCSSAPSSPPKTNASTTITGWTSKGSSPPEKT